MAKTQEEKIQHLEEISFSNLVKAIDKKWSHTYIDPPEVEESDVEALLKILEEQ